MTSCIRCLHWSPKTTDAKLARMGFAVCKVHSKNSGETFSGLVERECGAAVSVTPEVEKKRREWLAKMG